MGIQRSSRAVDAETYRRVSHESWETLAPGWERQQARLRRFTGAVRDWLIEALALRPGETLLELSAGPGDVGFEVAPRLGENGRLVCSDFSSEMVEAARRRGAELGLENVDYRVIDAERIDLDDDSVDGVVCKLGYMLMADPGRALAETRRVLRPGGRLALAVLGAAERNAWFGLAARVLQERGSMAPPDPDGPNPFSMASEDRTRTLLEGAGFGSVRIREVPLRPSYRDLDDYLSFTTDTAGPLAMAIRELSEAEREDLRTALGEAFAPFATAEGYELPGLALCAVAR